MPNVNCLEGMRCPNCGSEGPFRIRAEASFTVTDDGTCEEYDNVEWYDTSSCACLECKFQENVEDFKALDIRRSQR
jgi:hypothetical protein